MKKKFAILGSTGSIGINLLQLINKKKINCQISLLTCNKNYKLLLKQSKIFNVKNVIIFDKKVYKKKKELFIKNKINIYNKFHPTKEIFDYTMCAISGLDGIIPTLNIIKNSKKISIANKEVIICAWPLIEKKLRFYKTTFVPVDSEHFSIWYSLKNNSYKNIQHVYLTASGGPFLKKKINELKNVSISETIKHPNWKMGKKISIDSATMMNKVFEIIEAKNIFELNYKDLRILIHPKSYVHAIIQFKNGMSKIIAHDTNMVIPIFNTLYSKSNKKIKSKDLRIDILNNLSLKKVNLKRFPLVNILKYLPNNHSLYETLVVSINDTLVNLFLDGKINFTDISKKFIELINLKEFNKYKKIRPNKIRDIINLDQLVRLKILTKHV